MKAHITAGPDLGARPTPSHHPARHGHVMSLDRVELSRAGASHQSEMEVPHQLIRCLHHLCRCRIPAGVRILIFLFSYPAE